MTGQIALLIYIFGMVPGMLLGYYFARTKRFRPQHKYTMTAITVINWVIIALLMFGSYRYQVGEWQNGKLADADLIKLILPTIHLLTGGIAQLLATYLVILMWTEDLKVKQLMPFRIKNIKTPMRITLGLWLTTVLLGLGIYAVWYALPSSSAQQDPAATEVVSPESTESANPVATEEASPGATEEAESSG